MDIEIRGRKILLIGNGFDLAHGLPTSYSYFLDFCDKVSRIFTYLMYVDQKVYEKSALNIWDVDDSIKAKLLEWYKKRNENPDKLAVEIYNNIKENYLDTLFFKYQITVLGKKLDRFLKSEISNVIQAFECIRDNIERRERIQQSERSKVIKLEVVKECDKMETLFDQYKELNINGSLICLEQVEDIYSYFCYPTNAKAIGFEGSIMYCFIEPYGEMVFACNPDTCADVFVYPLARTFEDFMRSYSCLWFY